MLTIKPKSNVKINNKHLILGCGALSYDLLTILKQNPELAQTVKLQCLPASLHNTPQLISKEVDKYLAKNAYYYKNIFIAYADCGTVGELDKVIKKYNAKRIEGAHCYEFFAGKEQFTEIIEQELGSFFVTDYLIKNFARLVIKGLGLDKYPELFDDYFKHYKKLVYLAQTDDEELQKKAKEQAKDWGFEYEYHYVGIQGLADAMQFITLNS